MGRRDDRGMSLVELIIVIALMGIVLGMTGYGLALVSKKPVEECAKKIEMVLNQTRTNAMGSTEAYVEFYLNDKNRVTVKEYLLNDVRGADSPPPKETETVIGADGVKVRLYYRTNTGEAYEDLDSNRKKIGFKRDSGSVTGDVIHIRLEVYQGEYSSAGHIRTIELDTLTGKVRMD